jgi:hypothetical protein
MGPLRLHRTRYIVCEPVVFDAFNVPSQYAHVVVCLCQSHVHVFHAP